MTIKPAYGRNYPTKSASLQAWRDGKDFDICSPPNVGRKVSIRDLQYIKEDITVRYNHDQDCFIIQVE